MLNVSLSSKLLFNPQQKKFIDIRKNIFNVVPEKTTLSKYPNSPVKKIFFTKIQSSVFFTKILLKCFQGHNSPNESLLLPRSTVFYLSFSTIHYKYNPRFGSNRKCKSQGFFFFTNKSYTYLILFLQFNILKIFCNLFFCV